MKLFHKATDERVVAEANRVYKVGFFALTAGIVLDLILQLAGVRWTVSVQAFGSLNMLEWVVVIGVNLLCVVLLARKGLMDDNAYAEAERYPLGYYLLVGTFAGIVATAAVYISQYLGGAPWAEAELATKLLVAVVELLFTVPTTVVLVLLMTYASFRYARRRRTKSSCSEERE